MKKLVLFLVVLLIVALPFRSVGESIDLDSMSLEELMQLGLNVQKKIFERDEFSKGVLYPGNYKTGIDLEVGDYIIKCVSLMPENSCAWIYHHDSSGKSLEESLLQIDESYRVRLGEGHDILQLIHE